MALFDIAHMGRSFVARGEKESDSGEKELEREQEREEELLEASDSFPATRALDDTMIARSASQEELEPQLGSEAASEEKKKKKKKKMGVSKLSKSSYESISMELSNSLSIAAHKAGYGPAFKLLKSMNQNDRELIMELLLIGRRGPTYNDEIDAYDIILKSIFGLRARTNSALRQMRILSQSTWVHTLLKTATALNISRKMVLSSGDWRIPTRITHGVSNRAAMKAVREEFSAKSVSSVLDKAEHKFYKSFRRNIEIRLGDELVEGIYDIVIAGAGEQFPIFKQEKEKLLKRKTKKIRKRALSISSASSTGSSPLTASATEAHDSGIIQDEEPSADQNSEVHSESAQVANANEGELLPLAQMFQIETVVQNIEQVKPGFGVNVLVILEALALRTKIEMETEGTFTFTDQKDMLKKMALVGAKDGFIGLSLGVPLATFVNPFLGFPLMGLSFVNLSLGSTELNIIECVIMIMMHQLYLAANGTSVHDL